MVLVIKLKGSSMYVKEIAINGKVFKTHFIDQARAFDNESEMTPYTSFLTSDGYDFEIEPWKSIFEDK